MTRDEAVDVLRETEAMCASGGVLMQKLHTALRETLARGSLPFTVAEAVAAYRRGDFEPDDGMFRIAKAVLSTVAAPTSPEPEMCEHCDERPGDRHIHRSPARKPRPLWR